MIPRPGSPASRWWVIAALTVACDQLSKWAAATWLAPIQSLPLLPGILHLTYVQNTGAAFGLFRGGAGWLILVAIGIAAWLGAELTQRDHAPLSRLGLSLILGGAVGNLIDRVRVGSVIDFIDLRVWPVFNLADSAITIGISLLLLLALRGRGARGEGRGT